MCNSFSHSLVPWCLPSNYLFPQTNTVTHSAVTLQTTPWPETAPALSLSLPSTFGSSPSHIPFPYLDHPLILSPITCWPSVFLIPSLHTLQNFLMTLCKCFYTLSSPLPHSPWKVPTFAQHHLWAYRALQLKAARENSHNLAKWFQFLTHGRQSHVGKSALGNFVFSSPRSKIYSHKAFHRFLITPCSGPRIITHLRIRSREQGSGGAHL